MAYSSNSSTGSVGTSSMGSSIGTTSSTSTGSSGASVGTSASTGMNSSGPGSSGPGSTGAPDNTGFTGLSYSDGTWSPNSNLGTLSPGAPGLPGFASNNFGTGWSGNSSSSGHAMTVDEVYGKNDTSFGNQSIVENQGDYEASSNEKSDVETSTFGKQDDITVTPESITENKGLVDNDAVESIEGLNFQRKGKESQDVLEARKSRDEAEAEDKANQMRDSLKAKTEETLDEEAVNDFQIGEKNDFEEQSKARLNELNNLEKDLSEANKALEESKNAKLEADKKAGEAEQNYQKALDTKNQADDATQDLISRMDQLNANPITNLLSKTELGGFKTLRNNVANLAEKYNIEVGDISKANVSELKAIGKKVANEVKAFYEQNLKTAENELTNAQKHQKDLEANQNILMSKAKELESKYTEAQEAYKTFEAEYWTNNEKSKAEETPAYKANIEAVRNEINNSDLSDEQKSQALETINNVEVSIEDVSKAANDLAANPENPATIEVYVNAVAKYNKNLKNATKDNSLKNTDFDKTFTEMVAKANDFDVTLADGSKQSFAEFAAEMATKSPALAKGLYEAKANTYEEAGHTILAQIERAKANMVTTWLGSKFTLADNQVRAQFNQMAKTDMRATYATYNNVLNDPNASPEAKAEAQSQIAQANALMVASAALQASTGFLSGIGDSMKDGVYGTTDPGALNTYQETLNAVNNFIRITLGLGVTPGANEAYQNMYYLAGAKVNNSALFTTDFDGDGFALCQEYGNSAAAGMIAGAGELATSVALIFNPATVSIGLNLAIDSVQTFLDGLYGVQREARKSMQYSSQVLSYLQEAKDIAAETGNKEVINAMSTTIDNAVKQIENFQLKSDEVGNLDNWLEGSGSNTATNEKFNQSLSYDEWLKLIEADPTMRDYAKKLIAEKKEK